MSFSERKAEIVKLYEEGKYVELGDILEKLFAAEPQNFEVTWFHARNIYDLAELEVDVSKKLVLLKKGQQIIDGGLALPGGDQVSAFYKWKGIYLSEINKHVGTKERIEKAYDIRKLFEKAMELDPNDGTPPFLLGNWCYEVADVSWVVKKIAAAIFAEPPNSSYQDALKYFLKSAELAPNFKRNLWCVTKTYNALGDKAKAAEWAAKAAAVKSVSKADREIDEHVKPFLKK